MMRFVSALKIDCWPPPEPDELLDDEPEPPPPLLLEEEPEPADTEAEPDEGFFASAGAAGAVASTLRVAVAATADVAAATAARSVEGSGVVVRVVESDDMSTFRRGGRR